MDDRENSSTLSLVEDDQNDIEFTLVALREGIFVACDEKIQTISSAAPRTGRRATKNCNASPQRSTAQRCEAGI